MFVFLGEKLYIGYLTPSTHNVARHRMHLFIPGIIIPSKDSFTFCDYNSHESELPLETVRVDEAPCSVLTSKVADVLYWEPAEKFTSNRSLPRNVLMMDRVVRDYMPCLLFIAQVPPTSVYDSKIIGHYNKTKFPADFNGPIVGIGQAWIDENCWENEVAEEFYDFQFKSFNVNVFYDGKIFEASNFSFLCVHKMPKLSHYTLPEVNWEAVSDGPLPSNALPAGVYTNGEILYVGKRQHHHDKIPGYFVPKEKTLHLCCGSDEHCYDKGFKVLTVEEQDAFEWGTYSGGEIPSTAIPGGNTSAEEVLYIGRTVTNSDVTLGKTWQRAPINLPHGSVTNTQLVGKIHCSHRCLYVPWGGKEYIYPSYEVLMAKLRPKSLQHLCRNMIITATLAIPDRIDKLCLPLRLKEFCKVLN